METIKNNFTFYNYFFLIGFQSLPNPQGPYTKREISYFGQRNADFVKISEDQYLKNSQRAFDYIKKEELSWSNLCFFVYSSSFFDAHELSQCFWKECYPIAFNPYAFEEKAHHSIFSGPFRVAHHDFGHWYAHNNYLEALSDPCKNPLAKKAIYRFSEAVKKTFSSLNDQEKMGFFLAIHEKCNAIAQELPEHFKSFPVMEEKDITKAEVQEYAHKCAEIWKKSVSKGIFSDDTFPDPLMGHLSFEEYSETFTKDSLSKKFFLQNLDIKEDNNNIKISDLRYKFHTTPSSCREKDCTFSIDYTVNGRALDGRIGSSTVSKKNFPSIFFENALDHSTAIVKLAGLWDESCHFAESDPLDKKMKACRALYDKLQECNEALWKRVKKELTLMDQEDEEKTTSSSSHSPTEL